MNTFKVYLYYYLGHLCYLIGMKYIYIETLHSAYSCLMEASSELDTEGKIWTDLKGEDL